MVWAGTTIYPFDLPINGRRVPTKWIDNDESLYWSYDEDVYDRATGQD